MLTPPSKQSARSYQAAISPEWTDSCQPRGQLQVLHLEWTTDAGETVIGVYQLMGWTTAPRKLKSQVEAELWVPTKAEG